MKKAIRALMSNHIKKLVTSKRSQSTAGYVIILILIIIVGIGGWYLIPKKEPIIGGCAGVYKDYQQECCDNWAIENNIVKIQCVGYWEIENNKCAWKCGVKEEFCGSSTKAECNSDSDCKKGGCSSQVCEGKNENTITTCEYSKCFNSEIFNLKCGCFEDKCQWN